MILICKSFLGSNLCLKSRFCNNLLALNKVNNIKNNSLIICSYFSKYSKLWNTNIIKNKRLSSIFLNVSDYFDNGKLTNLSVKWSFNQFGPNIVFHIETSHLICDANVSNDCNGKQIKCKFSQQIKWLGSVWKTTLGGNWLNGDFNIFWS